jgi:hypothetical protein
MANDEPYDSWWGKLLGGGCFVAIGYWAHLDFTKLETGAAESVRMNWILALFYQNLGHNVTVAIFGVAGTLAVLAGLRQLLAE